MKIFLMMLLFFLLIPNSFAWDSTTHEFICEQIYQANKNLNKILDHDQFLRGCNAPDTEFNDEQNHHCYVAKQCHIIDTSKIDSVSLAYFMDIDDCIEDSYFDCPALDKFEESIEKASKSDYSFYVGVSTHYYTDAHVPVHQVMGEDWWGCHLPFEKEVGENLKGGKRFWSVTQECDVYFPCERYGKTNRKCSEKYDTNVTFSYVNVVELIKKTDQILSQKLNLSYESDYSHLLKKHETGFLTSTFNKITKFFENLMSWFQR
jgi:hypothetical protein